MTATAADPATTVPVPSAETVPPLRTAGFSEAFQLLRPYRSRLVLAGFLGLGATLAGTLQPLLVARTVDDFGSSLPAGAVLLLFGLLIGGALLTAVQQLVLERTSERFAFDARAGLIRHIYRIRLGVLDQRDRGDLSSRVTADVSETQAILSSGLVELVLSLVTVAISIVLMALIDWVMLALAATVIVLVVLALVVIGARTRPAGLRAQNALGDLAGTLTRSLGSVRTIRATVSTEHEIQRALAGAAEVREAGYSVAWLRAMLQTFTGVALQLLLISVVAVGAVRVAAGALTVGQLSAFIMYLLLMAAPIAQFGSLISLLATAFGSLTRVLEVGGLPVEQDAPDVRPELPELFRRPGPGKQGSPVFAFENVSFHYPGRDGDDTAEGGALRGVSLAIAEGRTTAVVGPSGAGKSTLFALLERFYEPSGGTIRFCGDDVRRLPRDLLRGQIAYVEQDAPALAGTVRDNLLLGARGVDDERCVQTLMQVNLAPDPVSAAVFLGAPVGEGGTLLSGGERQRLAIARALLADLPILLLDEVTSNLDSNNERVVQDVIRATGGRQTIVVIAHRLSTVVAADSIVVLDQGRVVDQGTHEQLVTSSPLYRELAHNQLLA